MLLRDEPTHKDVALFPFMLACLECQSGDLAAAKARLERATNIDKSLRLKALDDPDLKPLWDSLSS